MGEYDSARALALRLIAKKGRAVLLVRFKDGAPSDSKTPWRPNESEKISYTVSAVIGSFGAERPDGRRRSVGDKLITIAASDPGLSPPDKPIMVPREHDAIEFDGEVWMLLNVVEVSPGDQDVIYQALVRRWPQRFT